MQIAVQGVLVNPFSDPLPNHTIRITSRVTSTIVEEITVTEQTDSNGNYSFILVEGWHYLEILNKDTYMLVGDMLVDGGTPTNINLNDLLNYSAPISPISLVTYTTADQSLLTSLESGSFTSHRVKREQLVDVLVHDVELTTIDVSEDELERKAAKVNELKSCNSVIFNEATTYSDSIGNSIASTGSKVDSGLASVSNTQIVNDDINTNSVFNRGVYSGSISQAITDTGSDYTEVFTTDVSSSEVIHNVSSSEVFKEQTLTTASGELTYSLNHSSGAQEHGVSLIFGTQTIENRVTQSDNLSEKVYSSMVGTKSTSNTHTNNGVISYNEIVVDDFVIGRIGNDTFEVDTSIDTVFVRGNLRVSQIQDAAGNDIDLSKDPIILEVHQYSDASTGPWHTTLLFSDYWKRDNISNDGIIDPNTWTIAYKFKGEDGVGNPGDTIYIDTNYSADGLSNWHGTLQAGDAYRRERTVVNGVPGNWSGIAKILGDNGDEIEIRSQFSIDGINDWHVTFIHGDLYERKARYVNGLINSAWGNPFKVVATSTFKSTIFLRQTNEPTLPQGGTWGNPIATGWSDGVPTGELQLWASTRIFTDNGSPPQQAAWTTPNAMTSTVEIDFEFSSIDIPGNPTDNPTNWHNSALEGDIWLAQRTRSNGVDGPWEIVKTKGESGSDSYAAYKSQVFKRAITIPNLPTGGSWADTTPNGWSDGIPAGDLQLWTSTRVFTENGNSPQQLNWTSVSSLTDTATTDYEYSEEAIPGNPSDNSANWHNTATGSDIWIAIQTTLNGVIGTWQISKIRGEDGIDGTNGIDGSTGAQGPQGTDGVNTYFHISYADTSNGGGFSQSPSGKLYIGTYVDSISSDASSGSNLWNWQLVKGSDGLNGSDGVAGTNGSNGETSYFHVAYANNSTGTSGFSTSDPDSKLYIGTYTDFTLADSNTASDYNWQLVKGTDGINGTDGAQGPQGADGVNTYFHIAYADNSSGGGFSQSSSGKTYIGTYVDSVITDAASGSTLWEWQLVQGEDGLNGSDGIAGTNGENGDTSYFHIAYATNSDGSIGFSTSDPSSKTYIGQYTDFILADSTTNTDYLWTLIKGEQGPDGIPAFKSLSFIRSNTTPSTPTGGTWSSPVPTTTGWEDGIPSGNAIVWSVSRIFTEDGSSPQQSVWSTPRAMTDTAGVEYQWSTVETYPGTPTTNGGNWGTTASNNDWYVAQRLTTNGVVGSWQVSKIRGEDGLSTTGSGFNAIYSYNNSDSDSVGYDEAEAALTLQSSDTSIGMSYPAFNVEDETKHVFSVSYKTDTAHSNGFYVRVFEYDSDLPDGKLAICDTSDNPAVQTSTRRKNISPQMENQPTTTSYQTQEFTYTPTSSAKWASITILNWDGISTDTLYVKSVDRVKVGTDGEDGIPGLNGSGWYSIVGNNGVWPGDATATSNFISTFGRVPQLDDHLFYLNHATEATASDGRRCVTAIGGGTPVWNTAPVYFDGDVIVKNTLSADRIVANSITGNEFNSQTTLIAGSGGSTAGMNGYDLATLPDWLGGGTNIYANYRFWSGAEDPALSNFNVDSNGILNARHGYFSGTINMIGTSGLKVESSTPFGPDNLLEWRGPKTGKLDGNGEVVLSTLTKVNAVTYYSDDNTAYFGGSILAGTLTTSVQNPSTNNSVSVSSGTFGSNGGQIAVLASLDSTGNTGIISGSCGTLADPQVTLKLYSSGTLVRTEVINGTAECSSEASGKVELYFISGSFTHYDNELSTADREYTATATYTNTFNDKIQRLSVVTQEA